MYMDEISTPFLGCNGLEIATQAADAKIRRYKWEVNYQFKSPDCYKKLAVAINGRTPDPTILAQQEDAIIVELKKSLVLKILEFTGMEFDRSDHHGAMTERKV
ncbi:hypothetical protein AAC387_Pa01g3493 [Persea americana]